MMKRLVFLAALPLLAGAKAPSPAPPATPDGWVAACEDWDDWDKPGPPFRIHGNSFYVGTCGIAAILVTSPAGHVLIDSGTEKGAAVIAANIRRLGFRLKDVKLLLHSHEHFDHVGGHAVIQRLTGATVAASVAAAPVLESGRDSPEDPQAGMHAAMTPVKVGRRLADGEVVRLGGLALTTHATPGHTPGALSWSWTSCARSNRDCRRIAYADSLSAVSADTYRFSDHPTYLATYRNGVARVAALPCDILITPHPSASDLRSRLAAGALNVPPGQCATYARTIGERLDERLAREAKARP